MIRVVFVCSGNICRSPIAAGLAKRRFEELGTQAAVISGGTLGINGKPAAEFARVAMREIGVSIDEHYSQGAEAGLMRMADHIVVMAPRHETLILQAAPDLRPKIVRMWEFASQDLVQIDDPVGKELEAFRTCRDLLIECVDTWMETL